MGQPRTVANYRSRMRTKGYTDISIRQEYDSKFREIYFVSATEPAGKIRISFYIYEIEMQNRLTGKKCKKGRRVETPEAKPERSVNNAG